MSKIQAQYSKVINASAEKIYAVLCDYEVGHKAILPKPYFADMTVESGGQGAGTVVWVHMNVMGVKRSYHMDVTEPEPGRVLLETDRETGVWSSFTLEPLNGGTQTRVTIANEAPASPGFAGMMERLMNPPITRRIFKKELEILAEYVQ